MEKEELAIVIALLTAVAIGITWIVVDEVLPGDGGPEPAGEDEEEPSMPQPPVAERRPHSVTIHGRELVDDYHWLRDASYPKVDDEDVLAYLEAENAYHESVMGIHQPLVSELFEELVARVEQDERSVPVKDGPFMYQWRFAEGAQYRTWSRTPVEGGPEEILLDETARAAGHDFYTLGGFAVSQDHRYLAFSEDTDGSERFTLRVRDLETGAVLPDEIPETIADPVWDASSAGFFYAKLDAQWRPYQARYHVLGTPAEQDVVVYEEEDPGFFVNVGRTQSRAFVIVSTGDNITSEEHLIPSSDPAATPILVAARRSGHEYYTDHAGETFFIRTNDVHPNFRIVTAPQASPGPESWTELMGPSDERYFTGLMAFRDFLAIEERTNALDQIRVRMHTGEEHLVPFTEPAYMASLGDTREFAVDGFRITYQSMVTPATVYDYAVADGTLVTRKVQKIPSGYDPTQYVTERLWATARDGTKVPVTLLRRKDFEKDGRGHLHLYGYGAYGYGVHPGFNAARLSLVDRGFAYAIAHVRGGDEMGRRWYEQGRLFSRTNAFTDFVDVARFLIDERYTDKGLISISGGSAGGSLMGYVVNSDPDLWGAVVAHVPFVDILNTMLDEDLPLTPIEWPIWGNPVEDPEAFEYIRSYSPYDNVEAHAYPPMFVTAGLNDPRVTYWEPAKWVARIRASRTDAGLLLLKTNMGAGHRGKSGRFQRLQETAEEFAFILVVFGLASGR